MEGFLRTNGIAHSVCTHRSLVGPLWWWRLACLSDIWIVVFFFFLRNLSLLLKIFQWNSFKGVNCALHLYTSSFSNLSHLDAPPVYIYWHHFAHTGEWASGTEAETTPKPLFFSWLWPTHDQWEALIQLLMQKFPSILSTLSQPCLWQCGISTTSFTFGLLKCHSGQSSAPLNP